MTRRGLVVGCGGTLGFAWTAVALTEVERQLGWDVRTAEVLVGTSAGSEMVAILGSGRNPAALITAIEDAPDADPVLVQHVAEHPGHLPPLPVPALPRPEFIAAGLRARSPYSAGAGLLPRGRGDASWLREFGDALADPSTGWVTHPATWIVAADVRTGARVAFGADDAPTARLGEAIAASWAIPGWFPPVTIQERQYVDGGAVSTASADVVAPLELDEVVVIAPMATHGGVPGRGLERIERALRRQMTRGLDREIALLETRGTRVIRIEPGADELRAMGPNFMDLRRRPATIEQAKRSLPARVELALNRGVNA